MNDPIVVLSEFGTHLDIMLFTAGNVTPFIFIVVVIKFGIIVLNFILPRLVQSTLELQSKVLYSSGLQPE